MTEIFLLVWVFVSAADGDTLIVRDGSLDPLKPPHQPLALIAAGTNRYPHVRPRLSLNTCATTGSWREAAAAHPIRFAFLLATVP